MFSRKLHYLFLVLAFWGQSLNLYCQIQSRSGIDPELLINEIFTDPYGGVEIKNVKFDGPKESLAYFYDPNKLLGIEQGLILSTGLASETFRPNSSGRTGSDMKYPGWEEFDLITNEDSHDVSILEFDFIPSSDEVAFSYIFASDEYPEYIGLRNDAFVMFISGPGIEGKKNLAVLENGSTVCVNNLEPGKTPQLFHTNAKPGNIEYLKKGIAIDEYDTAVYNQFTFDGYSGILMAKTQVQAFRKYHLQIAIGDVGDPLYDSVVLLAAQSLHSVKPKIKIPVNQLLSLCTQLDSLGAELHLNSDSSVASFDLNIHFDFNSTEINTIYYPVLDSVYSLLQSSFNVSLTVIGHTDDRGTSSYNYQLSLERAKHIAYYLISKGINLKRIDFKGFGSTQPLASNTSEEGRARNRRVSFILQNSYP